MFHTYIVLVDLQSIFKELFYNFGDIVRDIFTMYYKCLIIINQALDAWCPLSVELAP